MLNIEKKKDENNSVVTTDDNDEDIADVRRFRQYKYIDVNSQICNMITVTTICLNFTITQYHSQTQHTKRGSLLFMYKISTVLCIYDTA